ncbi:hypothetical protein ACFQE1_18950, partial [Halobium palmae]
MSDGTEVTVRAPEDGDAERIRELVDASMTADYALSPEEIAAVVDAEFAPGSQRERFDGDDVTALV